MQMISDIPFTFTVAMLPKLSLPGTYAAKIDKMTLFALALGNVMHSRSGDAAYPKPLWFP